MRRAPRASTPLGADRSARFARAFLDHFLPKREPCAVEYPVPQCADVPEAVITTGSEILEYLEKHCDEPYSLYWNDVNPGTGAQAMLFHTRDGEVVFGLALPTESPGERLKELAAFVGAEYAYLGWEEPPPDTSREFIELCYKTEFLCITPDAERGLWSRLKRSLR